MASVDSALAGVQERDKWQRRLEVLDRALAELLERRRSLEGRLRRVRRELQKLQVTERDFVETHGRSHTPGVSGVSYGPILR